MTVGAGVIALVAMGSLYKIMALSGGGARIAEMMNGQLVVDDSGDPDKQRLLNVVEEMAIAAGLPVPPVYLLEEKGINAFAAGFSPSDAVIGVTRGAITQLSRDELQGVIAHEFSHILNGDMRLNIRLMGILHGILLLGLIGYYILRATPRSRNSKGGGGIVFLGLGLVVIGYAGTFFGNLIKAAVSRQREYLADAAAVQFTRNPEGIGGALMRIGAPQNSAILTNPHSSEISHALFCQGLSASLTSFFATHPPLPDRIRKIIPTWDGTFKAGARQASPEGKGAAAGPYERVGKKNIAMMAAGDAILSKDEVVNSVGQPTKAHLSYARQLINDLPPGFQKAVHDPYGARALIYSLVLDTDEAERDTQLHYLKSAADSGVYEEVGKLVKGMTTMPREYRLPLVDMALATLRQLSKPQYQVFKKNLSGLVAADNTIDLFEWSLQKIVFHHLDGVFEKKPRDQKKVPNLKRAKEACTILLSLFAGALKQEGVTSQQAFAAAKNEIGWLDEELMTLNAFNLKDLNAALDDLARLQPRFKATLLKACAAIVTADKHVSAEETELLRAIADTLDCPIPPLIS
jgi:Zn-dependent protease with chaperone function/uncharacterized tellurite resistance protein B-like protein